MAWLGQCRVAFKVNADAILRKQEGRKSINKVLRGLAQESGIPLTTLRRWWKEQENTINGTDNITDENKEQNEVESIAPSPTEKSHPICTNCNKNPVALTRHGKPYSRNAADYGLCNTCRCRKDTIIKKDKEAMENNRAPAVCPRCGHQYYMNPKRIKGAE